LRIFAFTDFHGNMEAYRLAKKHIITEKPDFVIIAGDIINHDADQAKQLLSDLANAGRPVYFVPGNMDGTSLAGWRGEGNVHALHGRSETALGLFIFGLGGSPHGPFKTVFEYSEEEAATLLAAAARNHRGEQMVLVSHCPPRDTRVDRVSGGDHVGSMSVRRFVEQKRPILVVSGHVHEAQGTDMLGTSTLVNTGPARQGTYARITIENGVNVRFEKLV
jgi:Icc-related predicted phosphoesterase